MKRSVKNLLLILLITSSVLASALFGETTPQAASGFPEGAVEDDLSVSPEDAEEDDLSILPNDEEDDFSILPNDEEDDLSISPKGSDESNPCETPEGSPDTVLPERSEDNDSLPEGGTGDPESIPLKCSDDDTETVPQERSDAYGKTDPSDDDIPDGTNEETALNYSMDLVHVTISGGPFVYNRKAIKPKVSASILIDGKEILLERGKDFSVQYRNNKDAGKATLIIKGMRSYTGTIKKTFRIRRAVLTSASIKYPKMPYTGKAVTQTKSTIVRAKAGNRTVRLVYGRDYKITYYNNINSGTATMLIKGKGNYTGKIKKTFQITAAWDSKKTNADSLFSKEYKRLLNNKPINRSDPTGTVFRPFSSVITSSSVIPGLKQTHIVDTGGHHFTCHDMTPQGICLAEGYTIISAYCYRQDHGSVLYIMKDGKYLETVNLLTPEGNPFINHAGGLAFLNGVIYIAGDTQYRVYALDLQDIVDTLGIQDAVSLRMRHGFYTDDPASFLTSYNGKIYVGTFYMNEYNQPSAQSTLMAYDPETRKAVGRKLTLPSNRVQGAAFVKKGKTTYLLLSTSYGRINTSRILSVKFKKTDKMSVYKSMKAPNMIEGLAVFGKSLYVIFESAANEYRSGWGQGYLRPVDRVVGVKYKKLVS